MNIAIIGAGNVGTSLGKGWGVAKHHIEFGVADLDDAKQQRIGKRVPGATVKTVEHAVRDSDVVVLAVPWSAVPDALRACGDLSGRILIDVTNPLQEGPNGLELALGFSTSGGEMVAQLAPGASVFKTMNQVGFAVMSDTAGYTVQPAMFVAGDDSDRKPQVMALVADLGFEALDAGPLRNSRLLEPYAMLWIDQAVTHGAAPTNAFGMLRKETGQC